MDRKEIFHCPKPSMQLCTETVEIQILFLDYIFHPIIWKSFEVEKIFSQVVIHPLAANPDLSTSLNQYYSWPLLLSVVDCSLWVPLSIDPPSSLGPSFPPPLPISWEISSSGLCVGFVPKQTKRFSDWCTPTPNTMNGYIVSQSPHW